MKRLLSISLLISTCSFSGCIWGRHHDHAAAIPPPPRTIVTPDSSLAAQVISVNAADRFVILNFPDGRLPRLDQHLYLYRGGLRTAEVKVVGPQQDTCMVADIVTGAAQSGDTVRDQ
jgi:hypothetical protein